MGVVGFYMFEKRTCVVIGDFIKLLIFLLTLMQILLHFLFFFYSLIFMSFLLNLMFL